MADPKNTKSDKRQALRIDEKPGVARDRQIAEIFIDPAVHSMTTCVAFGETALGKVEITETLEAIEATIKAVRKGDLSGPEAMLVSQSHSLNAIFTELARRSALNIGQYIEASERYMRMALKAQAQCRATIETLAAIKNPPVVIAKQANISHGPQQVNNGLAQPRAENSNNRPIELLETEHGKRLDPGTASAPIRGDPALVAMETGHGA